MDPFVNPYSMGAGNPPPALAGRDDEITQFKILLGRLSHNNNAKSLIIWGLRGVGKTVLLLRLREEALIVGWITGEAVEVKSDTNFREVFARQAYESILILSRRKALGEKIKKLPYFFKAFTASATMEGNVEFTFDPQQIGTFNGDLEKDLITLFVEVGEVARAHETGIVFFIDEMQFLKEQEMEALSAAMHKMSQLKLPVALVGTGLPQLPGLMVKAKSYAERLFSYPRIHFLDDRAAREALITPALSHGVEFTEEALNTLIAYSGKYPSFLQAYARGAWDIAPQSPIGEQDVKRAAVEVEKQLDQDFFSVRFEKATPTERLYMAAMASLGEEGPYSTQKVAVRMGKTRSTQVSPHRNTLIEKGLIYSPSLGNVDFSVPQFAAFVNRRSPLIQMLDTK